MNSGCCLALSSSHSQKNSTPAQQSQTVDATVSGRNALIMEHLHLVRIIAKSVSHNLPQHVELDDLIQAGTLGLIDAARKFDTGKNVEFPAYAKHRIRGAILDSLRVEDPVSRDVRREQKKINATVGRLEQSLKRDATEAEIAQALNVDVKRIRKIQMLAHSSGPISISAASDDNLPEYQFPAAPEARPDSMWARTQLRNVVQQLLAALPERQRKVLESYYKDEMTMAQIGAALGVNESRVSQIHKKAVSSMEQQLTNLGIRFCTPRNDGPLTAVLFPWKAGYRDFLRGTPAALGLARLLRLSFRLPFFFPTTGFFLSAVFGLSAGLVAGFFLDASDLPAPISSSEGSPPARQRSRPTRFGAPASPARSLPRPRCFSVRPPFPRPSWLPSACCLPFSFMPACALEAPPCILTRRDGVPSHLHAYWQAHFPCHSIPDRS